MTIYDLIEEMATDNRYDKGDLIQIMREGYAEHNFEQAILNVYNAIEDTELVMSQGTTELVDMVKE